MMGGMPDTNDRFADRTEAGKLLAERLAELHLIDPVVYALPRGGVPVAAEIAAVLDAPLDLILVRKIGAPHNPELAVGAIVEGDPPDVVINEDVWRLTRVDDKYFDSEKAVQVEELKHRAKRYLGSGQRPNPTGRPVVVVDDGLATGATMRVALTALQRRRITQIIVALPVAPRDSLQDIAALADEVICLRPVAEFSGVSAFYDDFHQLTDEEVLGFL